VLPAAEHLPPDAMEIVDSLKESLGYLDACVAARISLETQLKQIFEKVYSLHFKSLQMDICFLHFIVIG